MITEPGVQFIGAANHWTGREGQTPRYVVIHGTAGFTRAIDVAAYFADPSTQASTHYVVGQDGEVISCVYEDDAAWSNGIISGPSGVSGDGVHHDAFWDTGTNPNLLSVAIEHVKPHIDNSDIITDAQKQASFTLIKHICERHNIPMRTADANGGITGHYSLDPVSRSRCPGPFPWDELWAFLKGSETMIPSGWSDNGTELHIPNCPYVVKAGFRQWILSHSWDTHDIPCENEQGANPLEQSHTNIGGGTRQRFNTSTLEWTPDRGVFEAYTGPELIRQEQIIAQQSAQIQQLQQQHAGQANISQAKQALNAIIVMAEQLKADGDTIALAAKNALTALGK